MPHEHGLGKSVEISQRTRRLLAIAIAPFVIATVVGLAVLWPRGPRPGQGDSSEEFVRARVLSTSVGSCAGQQGPDVTECRAIRVRLLEGPDKNSQTRVEVVEEPNAPNFRAGETVVFAFSPEAPEEFRYAYDDHERRIPLLALALLFAIVVVALARWKGVMALVGFALSLAVLTLFIIPAILDGRSPLLVAIVGASAVMLGALYLAHGINGSTTTAALGTFVSLALIGTLAAIFVAVTRLTGIASEEAIFLNVREGQLNLRGLVLAGIVIGSLGVLDDVTITQASAVWELRRANPGYGFGDLYRSALRIGRDHIASTVNTLLLAYAGAALPLFILFTIAQTPLDHILNGQIVAEEIVRTLVGSIGLAASVPITTALAALVASRNGTTRGGG
jgi:uncharacterized membrane protein